MNGPTQTGFGREVGPELGQLRRREDIRVAADERRVARFQVVDDGVRPGRGDAVDARVVAGPGRAGVGHEALDRGDDRLRVERRAVVELDSLAQLDRVAELVLRDHRHRGGEHRDQLQFGVEVVEPLAHGREDHEGRAAPAHRRIEGVRVAPAQADDERPAVLRRRGRARGRRGESDGEARYLNGAPSRSRASMTARGKVELR